MKFYSREEGSKRDKAEKRNKKGKKGYKEEGERGKVWMKDGEMREGRKREKVKRWEGKWEFREII